MRYLPGGGSGQNTAHNVRVATVQSRTDSPTTALQYRRLVSTHHEQASWRTEPQTATRPLTILYRVLLQMALRRVHINVEITSALQAVLVVPIYVLTTWSLAVEVQVISVVPTKRAG